MAGRSLPTPRVTPRTRAPAGQRAQKPRQIRACVNMVGTLAHPRKAHLAARRTCLRAPHFYKYASSDYARVVPRIVAKALRQLLSKYSAGSLLRCSLTPFPDLSPCYDHNPSSYNQSIAARDGIVQRCSLHQACRR